MILSKFVVCLISTIFSFGLATRFTVISPSELAQQFTDDINFSLGHYGSIPYGAHLVGRLVLAEPIDACRNVATFHKGEEVASGSLIAVVRRGGCRVALKSRNAQLAGAKLVIIVDDSDGNLADWFGHEHGAEDIKIPTIMIDKSSGDKIIKYLEANKDNEDKSSIASITFPYDPLTDVANLDFWYSSADSLKSSFIFLKHFHQYWDKNRNSMNFVPHFVTWTNNRLKKGGFKDTDDDCLSSGRYCSPDPDDSGPLSGADVVYEDLRQLCIYHQSLDLWWNYVVPYGDECLESKNVEQCGSDILTRITNQQEIDNINACIAGSFSPAEEGKTFDKKVQDNVYLKEQKDQQLEYTINQYPVLFINHKSFYGKLQHAFVVFEEVCKNLKELPADCQFALRRSGSGVSYEEESHTGRIVFIVVMLSLLSILVFYCCRRMIKRESRDMSMQVGGMVTRYFALKDTKEESADS